MTQAQQILIIPIKIFIGFGDTTGDWQIFSFRFSKARFRFGFDCKADYSRRFNEANIDICMGMDGNHPEGSNFQVIKIFLKLSARQSKFLDGSQYCSFLNAFCSA